MGRWARSFPKLRDLNREIFQNLLALTLTLDSLVAESGPGVVQVTERA